MKERNADTLYHIWGNSRKKLRVVLFLLSYHNIYILSALLWMRATDGLAPDLTHCL